MAPGQVAFSVHRASGFRALVLTLLTVSVLESFVVHLVVLRWSAAVAWALLVVSAYGAVFLLAHLRAVSLRPVTLTPERLCLRVGFVWQLSVPLADLRGVEAIDDAPTPDDGTLDMARLLVATPNLRLSFTAPVAATGMYGMQRSVTSVALHVDDRDGLVEALRQAR